MTRPRQADAWRPAFLVAIDTEGDDIWSKPRIPETRNAECLPRFQALCERHRLRPTYLANWEMAHDPIFQVFGRDLLARAAGEIGMHLHGWDTPPIVPLSSDDAAHQPYLFEYPAEMRRAKIERMTRCLEDIFGIAIVSHRAGRFGFDAVSARVLDGLGYEVDCSVTPHVSWRGHPGSPTGEGGADFAAFPEHAYWLNLDDIGSPGVSEFLEIPMTIVCRRRNLLASTLRRTFGRSPNRVIWLRPNGRNLADLLNVLDIAERERRAYVQFTLHSSEFMPGGSPTFRTVESIERLYDDMEALFTVAQARFRGLTLREYRAEVGMTRAAAWRGSEGAGPA